MKSWIKRAGISFFISIMFLFVSCVSIFSYLYIIYASQEICLITIIKILFVCMYFIVSLFYILAIKDIWMGYDKERKKQEREVNHN